MYDCAKHYSWAADSCMIVQDLALHDCHMIIFTAKFSHQYKVPENTPEAVTELKFPGGAFPYTP